MYVRCTGCLASTWIDAVRPEGLATTVECGDCGRRAEPAPIEDLGATVRDHYRRTLSYANQHGIDMPSAYAVLLGVMPLERAQALRRDRLREAKIVLAPAAADADRRSLLLDVDLGFAKAVARGHLNLRQALTRGDRDAFASRLVDRHGLPERLAYRVTDNRLSLHQALEIKQQAAQRKRLADRRTGRNRRIAIAGALAAIAVGWLSWQIRNWDPPRSRAPVVSRRTAARRVDEPRPVPTRQEALRAATEVRRNEQGRVLEVLGPDPAAVLASYCEAASATLEPLEITPTVPHFPEARLGLFRDLAALDSIYSIRIRQDARSRRWVAGSGVRPIDPRPAPRARVSGH